MADHSNGQKIHQEKMGKTTVPAGATQGDVWYVDSVNGNDGNQGESPRHALATLAQAVSNSAAGDTIFTDRGGSETRTATIAVNKARLKIICPGKNAKSGYKIDGAGTIDLLTVSAADVEIVGLNFAHTGATSSAAGILTTAAADRLHVENCYFDDSAITTTFTGFGVELTDDIVDAQVVGCTFIDCHRGVLFVQASAKNCLRTKIHDCRFFVGQATAFGIFSAPTGTMVGLEVARCVFIEADGDGTAATDAWDGTDGTDAASGPISFSATVDQYIIRDCRAYTLLATSFDLLNAINSGAAGDLVNNKTGEGGDVQDEVDDIKAALYGTAGIATFPAAAAAADTVSVAEVIRYLSEKQGYRIASKTITLGTGAVPVTENLFTVTGEVSAFVYGFIDTAVLAAGALTLELGVTGNTAAIIAITAKAQLAINRFWVDTDSAVGVHAIPTEQLISAANILHVIRDSDATAGAITYYCVYRPVSSDGAVAAA